MSDAEQLIDHVIAESDFGGYLNRVGKAQDALEKLELWLTRENPKALGDIWFVHVRDILSKDTVERLVKEKKRDVLSDLRSWEKDTVGDLKNKSAEVRRSAKMDLVRIRKVLVLVDAV